MKMKEMLENHLEIIVNTEPTIEENIGLKFIAEKILRFEEKEFEIPIGYVEAICKILDDAQVGYILQDNNEYVKKISLIM